MTTKKHLEYSQKLGFWRCMMHHRAFRRVSESLERTQEEVEHLRGQLTHLEGKLLEKQSAMEQQDREVDRLASALQEAQS